MAKRIAPEAISVSSPRRRGPITTKHSTIIGRATSQRHGVWVPRLRGDDSIESRALLRRLLARVLDHMPYALGRYRDIDVVHAIDRQRIDHRIRDRRQRADATG